MISFVYFDVGGVVIKDFSASNKWESLQQTLGAIGDKKIVFDQLWQKYHTQIELDLDIDSLVPEFAQKLIQTYPSSFSLLHEFIARFEPNQTIWPTIDFVQKHCRIGLLTNMYPRMFAQIEKAKLLPPVKWDVVIDSSIEKVNKPNQDIFVLAQIKAQCEPETILFIDNTQKHLDTAASLGWQTYLYDSSDYEQSSHLLNTFIRNRV